MTVALWADGLGIACWLICFWWMYSISKRQDAVLGELREQTQRIEALSRQEHDLIRDVHPAVHEIRDEVASVASAVGRKAPSRR